MDNRRFAKELPHETIGPDDEMKICKPHNQLRIITSRRLACMTCIATAPNCKYTQKIPAYFVSKSLTGREAADPVSFVLCQELKNFLATHTTVHLLSRRNLYDLTQCANPKVESMVIKHEGQYICSKSM